MANATGEALEESAYLPAPLDYEADNQDENIGPNIQIYLDLIALILVAFFLFLAVFLNLANISTVAGHSGLRATGYFHLIASFSVFNIVYFVIKLLYLALTSDFINLDILGPDILADW